MIDHNTCCYLLTLAKQINQNITQLDLSQPLIRLNLISPADKNWDFLFQISRSLKGEYRISLHHQEHQSFTGLARVDYNSGHKNPEFLNEHVPDFLRAYAGMQINESHIHFNVESYSSLVWAIPLSKYQEFPVASVKQPDDYAEAVTGFAKLINLDLNLPITVPLL